MEAINSSIISANYSIPKCISTLDAIIGISYDTYIKVVDKFLNSNWKEIFMSMSLDRKKASLDRLM